MNFQLISYNKKSNISKYEITCDDCKKDMQFEVNGRQKRISRFKCHSCLTKTPVMIS